MFPVYWHERNGSFNFHTKQVCWWSGELWCLSLYIFYTWWLSLILWQYKVYPVSKGFSLAWLLTLTKSFTCLISSVLGLFYTQDVINKPTMWQTSQSGQLRKCYKSCKRKTSAPSEVQDTRLSVRIHCRLRDPCFHI